MAKLKANQFMIDGLLITERPILYQTEMVQAIWEDRKNQTRRTNGLDFINEDPDAWNRKNKLKKGLSRLWDSTKEYNPNPISEEFGFMDPLGSKEYIKCPYGKRGDLLWVKENWTNIESRTFYQADNIDTELINIYELDKVRWKPSIHLHKHRSRIWLMIEDVRLERLQDISEEDAMAEGVESAYFVIFQETRYKDYNPKTQKSDQNWTDNWRAAKSSFESLWASINGEESWDQNPWVWVIKFRVISKTGRPSNKQILKNYLEVTGQEVING